MPSIDEKLIREALEELKNMTGFPFVAGKDFILLSDMHRQFPTINLLDQVRQWKAWMMDNDDEILDQCKKSGKINYRARLRRWCSNAERWEQAKCPGTKNSQRKGKGTRKYEFEKSSSPKPEEAKIQEVWCRI